MTQIPATVVTYPDGDVTGTATVVHAVLLADGRTGIVLDRTPFHPVDTAWPDQPADVGVLRSSSDEFPVVTALTGGVREGDLVIGSDLPVRMGAEGWTFVVVHVVDAPAPAVGESVEAYVDPELRAALSAGHTACHLASLALDAALADAWTKEVPTDAAGHPAFDMLAIQTSRITAYGSTDVYRIGKSLRRKGFDPAALDDLRAVEERANATLAGWAETPGAIGVHREDRTLAGRRTWRCELPEGAVELPCGGTHLTSLAEVEAITVALASAEVPGGVELTMTTGIRLAH
ncbi:metal-dependent hydrolase [Microbacterium sp. CnD16-F]|uniref:metal-dependent hydrolase n=1 Tax=Microbacterium sp. CnD16-F TaxID=2954493 RepID=UPI002097233B|nr:metal-dependent hydrolase [Microbacterium sp. CnD16-F]MCO7203856.1 metal-dependent hydrolase [Microbacterium sp. CnD16-F]